MVVNIDNLAHGHYGQAKLMTTTQLRQAAKNATRHVSINALFKVANERNDQRTAAILRKKVSH